MYVIQKTTLTVDLRQRRSISRHAKTLNTLIVIHSRSQCVAYR
ncbi:hypothetical protein BIW11_07760 [Tropilaelaps mercedesae]|uniref:Uncharacterized protein n=1 Tax=Tropilaelaps mercedesae TaxID=418985 RepID=A0A1V9XSK8_9ACAR|nr:hypothetical protein BIW11_07760 [Tropilaelaps mercedesae]